MVGQSAGTWRVVAGNARTRLGPFHLNWPEPVLFGPPEQYMESNRSLYADVVPCVSWVYV